VNFSRDLVVQSSGSPTGPFIGPEGKDPFWTTRIFRQDLFGLGTGIDIVVTLELPETSNPSTVPFTTAYYFPGTDTPPADHILTLPLQTFHYTMVPDTTNPHTRITMASQAPIGTPFSPRNTPPFTPRYHALNASILAPTQISSRTPGSSTPSRHHLPGFILTLPPPPFRGPLPSSIRGTDPSGTILYFTHNYQIPVGGQFHQGGQTQPSFAEQIATRMQPLIGGKPPFPPPYGKSIPPSLAQYHNNLIQHNPHLIRGKQPQASSIIPPSTGQPYPSTSNPIWGSNAQTHGPVQG
jgi:hypothetical protein